MITAKWMTQCAHNAKCDVKMSTTMMRNVRCGMSTGWPQGVVTTMRKGSNDMMITV